MYMRIEQVPVHNPELCILRRRLGMESWVRMNNRLVSLWVPWNNQIITETNFSHSKATQKQMQVIQMFEWNIENLFSNLVPAI